MAAQLCLTGNEPLAYDFGGCTVDSVYLPRFNTPVQPIDPAQRKSIVT